MHGRPRQKGPPDPGRVKAAQQKAALFGQLAAEVLQRRMAQRYDAESLALSAKLLELNPEVYTVWNYRREALAPVLAAGGDAALEAVARELALTEKALHRNPKSYATWHHRKWLVEHRFSSLEAELALVGLLLDADERNFHGWAYRRFVVQLMGTPAERELEYAERKINQNFSNYSAWHSRTVLLPVAHGGSQDAAELQQALEQQAGRPGPELSAAAAAAAAEPNAEPEHEQPSRGNGSGGSGTGPASGSMPGQAAVAAPSGSGGARGSSSSAAVPKAVLDGEYELVKQAFFTEPEDQSGWFYHRWLLGCSLAHWEQARGSPQEAEEAHDFLAVLAREAAMCEELLAVEPEAKWPMLTLVRLRELQRAVGSPGSSSSSSGGGAGGDRGGDSSTTGTTGAGAAASEAGQAAAAAAADGEIQELYARLEAADPLRTGYYQDARSGKARAVAAALSGGRGGSSSAVSA